MGGGILEGFLEEARSGSGGKKRKRSEWKIGGQDTEREGHVRAQRRGWESRGMRV